MTIAIYVLQAWLLSAYLVMAATGRERPFHLANAFGGAALVGATVVADGWNKLLVLTVFFTIVGAYGAWRTR